MTDEHDAQLMREFPKLYAQRYKPMTETCMCWGFSVGDGWFNILYALSCTVDNIIENAKTDYVYEYKKEYGLDYDAPTPKEVQDKIDTFGAEASQVKEKYGTLRYYYGDNLPEKFSEQLRGAVRMAENLTVTTCEECGSLGKRVGMGWISTRCKPCAESEKIPWESEDEDAKEPT